MLFSKWFPHYVSSPITVCLGLSACVCRSQLLGTCMQCFYATMACGASESASWVLQQLLITFVYFISMQLTSAFIKSMPKVIPNLYEIQCSMQTKKNSSICTYFVPFCWCWVCFTTLGGSTSRWYISIYVKITATATISFSLLWHYEHNHQKHCA